MSINLFKFNLLSVISVLLLSGCASTLTGPASSVIQPSESNGLKITLIPASYRETYFKSGHSIERMCRSPDPDFNIDQNDQASLGLGVKNLVVGETQQELSLGGRTETVLIVRELMYRACELVLNINADAKTSIEIYERFFKLTENQLLNIKDQSEKNTSPGINNPVLPSGTAN